MLGVFLTLAALSACQSTPHTRQPAESVPAMASETQTTREAPPAPGPPPSRAAATFPGSGKLVNDEPSASTQSASTANGIQLSFTDANISEVVATVLGDGLGLNYTIDPQVKGTMSLQSSAPIARDQVLPALEDALRLQGFGIVISGDLYRIVPLKDAQRAGAALRFASSGAGSGYSVQIVALKYTGAQEMEKIIEPFAPQGGIVRVDEARNLLVLAGTSSELRNMLEIVNTFDVDWLSGMSFAIYTLSYVDAKTLTSELGEVFADSRSPLAGVVRLVPIPRLNSVMVITPQAHYLTEVERWIKRLDLGGSTSGRRIYVYDVQNGKAEDLAKSLAEILSLAEPSSSSNSSNTQSAPLTSTLGMGSSLGAGSSLGSSYGAGAAGGQNSLMTAPAPRQSALAAGGYGGPSNSSLPGANGLESGGLRIVTNETNNSILIFATASEFSVIESALSRLDQAPRQVLIEASIAEVTLTNDLQFGLQWSQASNVGTATLSNAANGAISQSFPGFSYLYTGSTSISAVLNTIQSHTAVRVLSSPKILVLNNHEATLDVGDEVPVVTQSAVSTVAGGAPVVNSVDMKDTGVILQVTPHVNKNGLILLDISQQVSDVIPTTSSSIDSPTIEQRNLSTSIAVQSGDTIALGGLISSTRTQSRTGLPFLSRIPILGALFGSTDNSSDRTELIMLLTPRVIQSEVDLKAATDDLRNEFNDLKKDLRSIAPVH
jgi:general secretion pathway protein D